MARPASGTNLTIAQLQRVLNEKHSELQKLERQRANLQKKLSVIDRQIERVGGGANALRGRGGAGAGFTAGGRARNEHSLLETLESVFRGAGKPMKVQEILDGVLATGYRSGSANFRGIINQTIIKDKRFGQVQRGVYELKGGGESKKKSSKSAAA
jgi:septal ring factor EnvC (AmiA/AmiB activator)